MRADTDQARFLLNRSRGGNQTRAADRVVPRFAPQPRWSFDSVDAVERKTCLGHFGREFVRVMEEGGRKPAEPVVRVGIAMLPRLEIPGDDLVEPGERWIG